MHWASAPLAGGEHRLPRGCELLVWQTRTRRWSTLLTGCDLSDKRVGLIDHMRRVTLDACVVETAQYKPVLQGFRTASTRLRPHTLTYYTASLDAYRRRTRRESWRVSNLYERK